MDYENNLQFRALSPQAKGLGDLTSRPVVGQVADLQWNILSEDVSLPVAVLRNERIEHNLRWMSSFIETYKVKLAPHGKTTMSPALFQRQLKQGAWGITLATAPQVQAAYYFGVRRVIMANQLVGRANMNIIARLQQSPDFDFYCIVDSVANIEQLGEFFAQARQQLKVLIELGVAGGRTGARNDEAQSALVEAIARWPQSLALAGIEVYEGVLKEEAAIRTFLRRAREQLRKLQDQKCFATDRIILTGAGSAWFDLVAEEWSDLAIDSSLDIILRPGCYLTHDVGAYKAAASRIGMNNPIAREMQTSLLPALQIWAYVLSVPESGVAILGLGKRDAAFDAGLPTPALHYRPGAEAPVAAPADWQLTAMMDQHAFMRIEPDADIAVGDMLALDISHPCLTFDKWRQLLVVDETLDVIDLVETFF
jgi:D-serine dehydratase